MISNLYELSFWLSFESLKKKKKRNKRAVKGLESIFWIDLKILDSIS